MSPVSPLVATDELSELAESVSSGSPPSQAVTSARSRDGIIERVGLGIPSERYQRTGAIITRHLHAAGSRGPRSERGLVVGSALQLRQAVKTRAQRCARGLKGAKERRSSPWHGLQEA